MGQAIWKCPSCGPVGDALYGDDERFHCSGLDCDEVVWVLTEEERSPPKRDYRSCPLTTEEKRLRGQAKITESRERAAESAHASKEGRGILAAMSARNDRRRRVAGKTTKKTKTTKKDRHGKCSGCGEVKWLLRIDPPTCAGCYHAVNPPNHRRPKPKQAEDNDRRPKPKQAEDNDRRPKPKQAEDKVRTTTREGAPARKRKLAADVADDDDLAHECRAIEECSRALRDLSPQAIERVLGYTLHRYSQTSGLNTGVIRLPSPLLSLSGPDPA